MEAMRTYLLAKLGRTREAKARLKLKPVNDMVVRGFDGLAWAAWGIGSMRSLSLSSRPNIGIGLFYSCPL